MIEVARNTSSVNNKMNRLITDIDRILNDIEDKLSRKDADMVEIKNALAQKILPKLRDQRDAILKKFKILIQSGCYVFNDEKINKDYKDKYDYDPMLHPSFNQGAYEFNLDESDCSYTHKGSVYKGSYLKKLKDIDKKNMCCGYNKGGWSIDGSEAIIDEYLDYMYDYIDELNEYIKFFESDDSGDIEGTILEYKEFNKNLLKDF